MANQKNNELSGLRCVEQGGPWPFITRRVFERPDHARMVWQSRHHRKGLLRWAFSEAVEVAEAISTHLRLPRKLNWWIGGLFAVGSLLFGLASVLGLSPDLAMAWSMDSERINAIFFVGSISFTFAAYLQLYQSANTGTFPPDLSTVQTKAVLFGWRPADIGWLSSALQFLGTLLFNVNTFDAMIPSLSLIQRDFAVWVPGFIGSVFFLVSGYLAFIETCHSHWAWKPKNISWWVVFINMLGCVGFMVAAVFAGDLLRGPSTAVSTISVLFTLLGAIGFLVGSLLMLQETVSPSES